ncbi:MAG: hypothetical protein JNL21_22000 [Myxococcales bacterium]|nr:hypothetical protein [Myxococcales bacterium]
MTTPFRFTSLSSALLASLALIGCSSTVTMTPAASVPFAQGEVDPSFEDNGNGSITVRVAHLGDPAKLASGATTYVVWIQPDKEDAPLQNVGALKVDDDFEGELTITTTFRNFAISVTPESAADVTKPSGAPVLTASVSD